MVTVFLITVIHTVKHVITAPSFRDTVSMVPAKELVLSALFHTVHLVRDQKKNTKIIRDTLHRWSSPYCGGGIKKWSNISMETVRATQSK